MGRTFIPRGDQPFAEKARIFANAVARDPSSYELTADDAQEVVALSERFHKSLVIARGGGTRSMAATRAKDEAREQLEATMKRLVLRIRAAKSVSSETLFAAGLSEGAARRKRQSCPQEPPRLKFVQALHRGVATTPMHELSFGALEYGKSRPAGAVRLELFVDLVSPDEAIPKFPGANHGGRPWYLRSFTRSPIKLIPPMTRLPMRVVYWGRWADSTGNVGPFSATAAGWIEGGSHHLLAPEIGNRPKRPALLEDANDARDPIVRVVVLEAQVQSYQASSVEVSLPALEQREQKQLEAPREAA